MDLPVYRILPGPHIQIVLEENGRAETRPSMVLFITVAGGRQAVNAKLSFAGGIGKNLRCMVGIT
jgi:hypothetical protein